MPHTATFLRSTYSDILLLLQAQISTITGLDSSRVIITLDDPNDVPLYAGDRDILVRPGGEPPGETREGGGRVDGQRRRSVTIACRARSYLDMAHTDAARLTDATLGFIQWEDRVVDACENFMATDASENALTLPMCVNNIATPVRLRSDPGWVYSTFEVSWVYERAYDQTRT